MEFPLEKYKWPYIVGSTRGLLLVAREYGYEGEEDDHQGLFPIPQEEEEEVEEVPEEELEEDGCSNRYWLANFDVFEINERGEEEEEEEVPEEVPEEELEEDGCSNRCWLANFDVFEIDLSSGRFKQTKSLGDRAIFVGHNTSISVDCASEFPRIKSNHIYFTDDYVDRYVLLLKGGGEIMGAYNMKDGQTTPFKIEESSTRSRISPPFWFIPSL